ncbi:hypothetical protein CC80DRAFT_543435 [Byssothecium circinans]|uniref:Uncharacterized protein n=1 Tax=Byssothecium circinans TaxID=147558 RepID=A0A6A5UB80_9PLEO|nr:hypothetical protein CC80DRAFT_543435 [Byssothecium circinans]
MPPKRKNKGTSKAPAATALRGAPAELAQPKRRNSVQGGKTSRLPSIALHMTTRQAAKTASNHTSSGAPSLASTDSRRSSLNSLAQFEDAHSEIVEERPAKRARLSTDSGSPQPSATSTLDQNNAVNGTQTPEPQKLPPHPISNGPKTSGRKRRASDGSSQSSQTVSARPNGVLTRTESDVSEVQPRRKRRKTTQTPADSADVPPELTDASTAPNSPEQLVEVDSSQNLHHVLPTNGDAPAKLGRRLPGRRRAPHPDVNIETDLRRQLNLKMSYRSLAKLQKNILEELSHRTTNKLVNDPDYYKQVPEYEPLMASLNQYKAKRLAQLNTLRRERLEQLERVRIANKHIEQKKFIQRFRDLQEDLLLQCYYRMKQIDRRAKGLDPTVTDDEDNIVLATHTDFPKIVDDDRLGSKYASRSRAYVDTEKTLEEDILRKRLGQMQAAFVAEDEEADDAHEDVPAGFATFNGSDRTEAVAHWNMISLLDAAHDVESAPLQPLQPLQPLPPKPIPNEQAEALFLLASLSADMPQAIPPEVKREPHESAISSAELARETSSIEPVTQAAEAILPEPEIIPAKAQNVTDTAGSSTLIPQTNGMQSMRVQKTSKNETPARSTHRIMDMLNDDMEAPTTKPQAPQPLPPNQTTMPMPSPQMNLRHEPTPQRNGTLGPEPIMYRQEHASSQPPSEIYAASSQPLNEPASWSPGNRFAPRWTPRMPSYMKGMSEETLRKRDPLNAIRVMLDAKAISEGRIPASQRNDNAEHSRRAAVERERARDTTSLARPFSASGIREISDSSGKDTTKQTVAVSPSAPPLSYHQSPSVAAAYPPPPRSDSQDTTSSHWGRDRRLSGSQASRDRRLSGSQAPLPPSASPYAPSPPQPYHPESNKVGSSQAPHQSPYVPPSAPQLPSISSTLPPKPPGPPPNPPINFRFAHYDPAPSRSVYASPAPSSFPPPSHPVPYTAAPPPSPMASSYGSASYHGGYVPPPGSFQAPPPPPTALSPYPTLKIRQYGGQPILPANMAPPMPQSQPPVTFVGQIGPPPAYSPPPQSSSHGRTPSFEQVSGLLAESSTDRPAEGSSRQRRQYRSWHPPGTQFRSYQGPDTGRRRGG